MRMYGVMEEFSEGHKDMMEPPNIPGTHQRDVPSSVFPGDSTQEGHTIPLPLLQEWRSNRYRI
ncbi:unnamed protein product [Staurois parvus]|uniref:Uncharacterized protein n=1 Tax=Staurois parvus TaxID=386267 RepID=A0ABN9CW17_9NEOB|nr:unnamed protein product [Staurois parvus]